MKKRKLTPLTIALGLALVGNAYAANIVDGTLINSSTSFDEDTVYTVAAGSTTVASNSTDVPVVITIAEGKTLTLENTFANTQSKVIDASSKSGMVFEGGNVILRRDDTGSDKATEQYFIRATDGQILFGGPAPQIIGGVEFKNASTKMEGTIAQGIYVMGATSFTEGFDMTLNRSDAAITTPENTTGVHLEGGSLYTKSATIKMIAGAKDVAMRGIWVEAGGDMQAGSLDLDLDANNNSVISQTLTGLVVSSTTAGKAAFLVTGDVNISIKNAKNKDVVVRGMALSSDRDYSFGGTTNIEIANAVNAFGLDTSKEVNFGGDLNIKLSQINGADNYKKGVVGINTTGNKNNGTVGNVTVKRADIRITDSQTQYDYVPVRAVSTEGDSQVTFTDSLATNAGLQSVANSTIDVQKSFVTSDPVALTAQADSTILVNSSKQGTVHFSGYTERTASWGGTPNSTISMNIGSGADGDDSYWNVTQASTLTNLSLAKNASLYFKVRDTDLDGTDALITVTGAAATAVELASGSSIALYGSGFDLEAGKTIQLIKSDKGIVKDGKALDKGDSLDDLKGDLTVIDIKSLIRATETGFSKDQYDLSMKTEELLIATLKEKAPAPTPDPDPDPDPNPDPKPNPDPVPEPDRPSGDKVNDQTNALMQSSIAAAATMFAADELLIDTTMKSRQGVRQTGPFAAARVGRYDLDVRGDLETNVISGLLGYAVNLQGSEIGAFVEMGHGTYDTKTADVGSPFGVAAGDGKHNYVGFGVYGNCATPIDWLHVTGYVKGGWLRNEFSAPIAGVSVDFDRTSNYWGAHLGMYGEFQAAGKIKNRTFLNYFYDGRESESYEASGSSEVAGARFHFDALNVHRVQAGSLIEYQYSSTLRPYASVAYEYAFKANAEGSARDHIGTLAMNGTDLEGGTGILSLGWTYLNEANTFEFDCGVNGYAGVRKGVSAQLQAAWKF